MSKGDKLTETEKNVLFYEKLNDLLNSLDNTQIEEHYLICLDETFIKLQKQHENYYIKCGRNPSCFEDLKKKNEMINKIIAQEKIKKLEEKKKTKTQTCQ